MSVEAIKAAIEQLTEAERRELADWFEELKTRLGTLKWSRIFPLAVVAITWSRESIGKSMKASLLRWARACALGKSNLELYLSRLPGILGFLRESATMGPRTGQETI